MSYQGMEADDINEQLSKGDPFDPFDWVGTTRCSCGMAGAIARGHVMAKTCHRANREDNQTARQETLILKCQVSALRTMLICAGVSEGLIENVLQDTEQDVRNEAPYTQD